MVVDWLAIGNGERVRGDRNPGPWFPPLRHAVGTASMLLLLVVSGCRDLEVVTHQYGTLAEAVAEGAVDRGWLPPGLPPGTREIREAHDLDSNRRWGLFNFPPGEADQLRALLGPEAGFTGEQCNPPRRIEWWPVQLRGALDQERLAATGLSAYVDREGELMFAVNWNQGRAYYWTRD